MLINYVNHYILSMLIIYVNYYILSMLIIRFYLC